MTEFTKWEVRLVVLVVLLAIGGGLWEEHRSAQSGIDSMKQTIAAIEGDRKNEQQALQATLAAIAQTKKETITPAQVIRELPQVISLPAPIIQQSQPVVPPATRGDTGLPEKPSPIVGVIPQEDFKPLFDRLADCKACDAQVALDKEAIQQVTAERDAAVMAAKGGSFWHRVKHDAKVIGVTLVIGAAVGYAAHH